MSGFAVIQGGHRLSAVGHQRAPESRPPKGGDDFASFLSRSWPTADSRQPDTGTSLREAAGQLVADAFILPLLQTMHDSPLRPRSGPFVAGAAEKRFMPLLDQRLADSITKSDRFPLVNSIVRRLSTISRLRTGGNHAAA